MGYSREHSVISSKLLPVGRALVAKQEQCRRKLVSVCHTKIGHVIFSYSRIDAL